MIRPPPTSTLFPYTTLFRSLLHRAFSVFLFDPASKKLLLQQRAAEKITFPNMILDRKSTRLNSSHSQISYAVFCLKKKNRQSDGGHGGQADIQDAAHGHERA